MNDASQTATTPTHVITFYRFVAIDKPRMLQQHLKRLCLGLGLKGSILVSAEGLNGSLGGSAEALDTFKRVMDEEPRFQGIWYKPSLSAGSPFKRMTVKLKREIVTMGVPGIDPLSETGVFLSAEEMHEWMATRKDFLLIDVRNRYETKLGSFKGAIDPATDSFRQFPKWVDENLAEHKDKPIVTFCTGGIRCEKATAYMRKQGFQQVYQLHGGILNYLEAVKTKKETTDSFYEGECFVFDDRMAITAQAEVLDQEICPTCISILNEADRGHADYIKGKRCRHCAEEQIRFHQARVEKGAIRHQEHLEQKKKFSKTMRELHSIFRGRDAQQAGES